MKTFKPKNPVKTIIALLQAGETHRDAEYRLALWQIRYEYATGKMPANAIGLDNFRQIGLNPAP